MKEISFMIELILDSIIEGKEKVLEKYIEFINFGKFSELNIQEDIGQESIIFDLNINSEYCKQFYDIYITSDIKINDNSKYIKGLLYLLDQIGCEYQKNKDKVIFVISSNEKQKNLIKNIFEKFNPEKFLDDINNKFDKEDKESQKLLQLINEENKSLELENNQIKKKLNDLLKKIDKSLTKGDSMQEDKKQNLINLVEEIQPIDEEMKEVIESIKRIVYDDSEEVCQPKKPRLF